MAKIAKGYCDLNISSESKNLKKVVLQALSLGYQTIAINTTFNPDGEIVESTKKHKGDKKKFPVIPSPTKITLTDHELKQYNIKQEYVILSRITVLYSDIQDGFVHKMKGEVEKYDLIAFTPYSDEALKQIIQTLPFIDIISIDLSWCLNKLPRKLLSVAVERDIYFELQYSNCIGTHRSTPRKETIQLGRRLFEYIKSKNVFVSSGTNSVSDIRAPHDVINLCHILSLNNGLSQSALCRTSHDVVHCAMQRKAGANRCSVKIEIIKPTVDGKGSKRKRAVEDSFMTIDTICEENEV